MSASKIPLRTALYLRVSGLSENSCAGGHNGKEGDPIYPDAKSLRYRTICWINCWQVATPVPPSRKAACWTL